MWQDNNADRQALEYLSYLRPYLRQYGDSQRPAWHLAGRKLLDYLLVYIGSGRGRFVVAGESYDVQENDLYWIPPNIVHEMEGFAPSMDCCYLHFDVIYRAPESHWDFSIPGGMLDLADFAHLKHPPLPPGELRQLCGRIRGTTNTLVGRLMRQVCDIALQNRTYASVRTAGLLMEIIAEILQGQNNVGVQHLATPPLLESAAKYLRMNCAEPVRLETAAEIAGLSFSHFRKLFGIHYGCSPREYVRSCRIQQAKHLMVTTSLSLTQIAGACGFATVHSLSRAFHACEGVPPTTFRHDSYPTL